MSLEEQEFDKAAKDILVKLVTSLLQDKPKDPVSEDFIKKLETYVI
jgi:hypothetical protein